VHSDFPNPLSKNDRRRIVGTDWLPSVCRRFSTIQLSVQRANVRVQNRIYTIQYVFIPHAWFQTRTVFVSKDNRNRREHWNSKCTTDYIEETRRADSVHYCCRYNILVHVAKKKKFDVSCIPGLNETEWGFSYSPSWCPLCYYKAVCPINGVRGCWHDLRLSFSSEWNVKGFWCPITEFIQYCHFTLRFLPPRHYLYIAMSSAWFKQMNVTADSYFFYGKNVVNFLCTLWRSWGGVKV
jgi:hypothetical protein